MGFIKRKKRMIQLFGSLLIVALCVIVGIRMSESPENGIGSAVAEVSQEDEAYSLESICEMNKVQGTVESEDGELYVEKQYAEEQHVEEQYAEEQHVEEQYVEEQYVEEQYVEEQYTAVKNAAEEFSGEKSTEEQYTQLQQETEPIFESAKSLTEEAMAESNVDDEQPKEERESLVICAHEFKKSIWENPTCMNGGYYNNICQKCGLVECVTLEAFPHDPEDIVIQNGNCMEDTIIRHICKNCGLQIGSDTRLTPQIHEWVMDLIDGKEITYCEFCGVAQ